MQFSILFQNLLITQAKLFLDQRNKEMWDFLSLSTSRVKSELTKDKNDYSWLLSSDFHIKILWETLGVSTFGSWRDLEGGKTPSGDAKKDLRDLNHDGNSFLLYPNIA